MYIPRMVCQERRWFDDA